MPEQVPPQRDDPGIRAFLAAFCGAMARGDTPAAVSMWETPAMIVGEQAVRILRSGNDMLGFFAQAKQHYNLEGAIASRPDVASIHWATGTIAIVEVRWPHLDEENNELGAEVWTYVLRRAIKEWRIRVGIVHGAATSWDSGRREPPPT